MERAGRIENSELQLICGLKGLGLSVVVTKPTMGRINPLEAKIREEAADLVDGLVFSGSMTVTTPLSATFPRRHQRVRAISSHS